MTKTYHRELAFAERVAREAGALLLGAYGRVSAREKGPNDLVTEADTATQHLIARRISEEFPDHTLLAEEEGVVADPGKSWKWIVDPLDGTINFAHGFPFWAVSIGLEHNGRLVVGIVYNPLAKIVYSASLGGGTHRNGEPMRVSGANVLKDSLIGAALPTGFDKDADRQLAYFRTMSTDTHSVRRTGSTALNLAFLACGGLDLIYATSVYPWDVAAGILLVTEAGGVVTAIDGSPHQMNQMSLLGSNGLLHAEALQRLGAAWPGL